MGEVFLATDTQLGRKAAVKLLRPRNPHDLLEHSRLLREAQALATLSDENVIGIFDCGVHEEQVFLAMEYVEGLTLRAWQDAAPRTWREVLRHYLAAGRGLAAIHAAGLVHRDFKPQNVLVGATGRVKIVDFGLAVAPGERTPRAASGRGLARAEVLSLLATQLTDTSAVLGTALYISPEQLAAGRLDARSDQFSFCVALYEALYGGHPYAEPAPQPRDSAAMTDSRRSHGAVGTGPSGPPSMMSLVTGLVEGRLRRPKKIVISGRVYRAIERGLARDPADRFPSMNALLAALARDPLRKYGPWIAVAGLGGAIGALALVPTIVSSCKDIEVAFHDAWTPARAEAVRSAFIATGSAHARTAADRVDTTLTQYREQWIAARTDNCKASHDRVAQDLELFRRRDNCLDHARDTLVATVDQLTRADAATVESIADALALLPALETCDADFQSLQTCLDSADDPVLRGRLDRARALEIAGKFTDAGILATEVLDSAGDHPRLAAEAQLLRGRIFAEQSRAQDAQDAFTAAHELSEGAGCDELAFEAATRNTKLVALNYDLPADAGRVWSEVARSKLRVLPNSPRLEADQHSDLGLLLQHREDLAGSRARHLVQAEAEHNKALALRQKLANGNKTLDLAFSYLNLGMLAKNSAQPELALDLAHHSLEHYTAVYGAGHPLLWKPHRGLGNVLLRLGRLPEARTELEQALTLAEASLGSGHGVVGQLQYTLATVYLDQDPARALNLATAALAVYVREIADTNPQRAQPLELLGQIHTDRGEPSLALPYRQEALHRRLHAGPEKRAYAHLELAGTLQELNRMDESDGHIRLAEALLDELAPKPADLVDFIRELKSNQPSSITPTPQP
jgi:serine/threonine protein kinase